MTLTVPHAVFLQVILGECVQFLTLKRIVHRFLSLEQTHLVSVS